MRGYSARSRAWWSTGKGFAGYAKHLTGEATVATNDAS